VFVDIEPDTANIDADLIEQAITPRARAVLAVDAFGQPARLDEYAISRGSMVLCS
jgi:dTDP-4-amino-4,6-dideoxygalactose transaminase